MKKLLLISIMLFSVAIFAKKPDKIVNQKYENKTKKSVEQICIDRGHQFDLDSTAYVSITKEKPYVIDYEDSTILVTPASFFINRKCVRCKKTITQQNFEKREVIWSRPIIIIDAPIIINGVEYD